MEFFQIKQVSSKTGLSEQLIRKWEERYQAVQPQRLANGYRVYSVEDVARLVRIKHLVDSGSSVHQAVEIARAEAAFDAAVETQWISERHDVDTQEGADNQHQATLDICDADSPVVQKLVNLGSVAKLESVAEILERGLKTIGFHALVEKVIVPFLRRVGTLWSEGDWTEDQEHIATLSVRNFLVHMLNDLPDAPLDAPLCLASCIPGERHDMMLNIVLIEAKRLGWRTVFLGPEPAPGAIERSIDRLRPNLAILSVSTDTPFQQDPARKGWLCDLNDFARLHPATRFYVGCPKQVADEHLGACTYLHHVDDIYVLVDRFAAGVSRLH